MLLMRFLKPLKNTQCHHFSALAKKNNQFNKTKKEKTNQENL